MCQIVVFGGGKMSEDYYTIVALRSRAYPTDAAARWRPRRTQRQRRKRPRPSSHCPRHYRQYCHCCRCRWLRMRTRRKDQWSHRVARKPGRVRRLRRAALGAVETRTMQAWRLRWRQTRKKRKRAETRTRTWRDASASRRPCVARQSAIPPCAEATRSADSPETMIE
jgi:hypothetical protein